MAGRRAIDLTGKVFGRLTVVRRTDNQNSHAMWECVCECGRNVVVAGTDLRRGWNKSCGCLRNENSRTRFLLANPRKS